MPLYELILRLTCHCMNWSWVKSAGVLNKAMLSPAADQMKSTDFHSQGKTGWGIAQVAEQEKRNKELTWIVYNGVANPVHMPEPRLSTQQSAIISYSDKESDSDGECSDTAVEMKQMRPKAPGWCSREIPLSFRKNRDFLKLFETFWNFLEIVWKQFQNVSEICNLNFVTSELDSESLSTLRKNIFQRDSCKVDEVAAPVITSCAKNVYVSISIFFRNSEMFSKNSESQKIFKKTQKVKKYLKKIQKVSESQFTSKSFWPSWSCWRSRAGTAGTQSDNGKVSCRRRSRVEAAVMMKPAGKGGWVCGMCQVQSWQQMDAKYLLLFVDLCRTLTTRR